MPRAFSTRRFTFAYAGIMAALVALAAGALQHRYHQRQERRFDRRRESLQLLLVSSYRELGEARFSAWLANADFLVWASRAGT